MIQKQNSNIEGSKILVIDDHKNIRASLIMALENEGAIIAEAENCAKALEMLGPKKAYQDHLLYDLILLDIRLPDGSGLTILKQLSEYGIASKVIMISGEGTISDAYQATQLGAFDYIEKPFTPERIIVSAERCIDFNRIRSDHKRLKEKLANEQILLGNAPKIKALLGTIKKVAPTNGRVLIMGESGTGKELVAKEIHRLSERSNRSLVKINCAAIPENLIESELFGHEKGAFTGAIKTRKGVFERAHDATLFLDEVGELDLGVQAKLLRVLQCGELSRVGSEQTIKTDVRLIAATNRNLEEMVKNNDFREDLFYRLNVVSLHVSPLRERKTDIPILAEAFLRESCKEHSLGDLQFSEGALRQLMECPWQGNVRELKNFIERAAILSEDQVINELEDLPVSFPKDHTPEPLETRVLHQEQSFEYSCDLLAWHDFHQSAGKLYLKYVLRKAKGNVSEAARLLCLERAYLHRLMRKLGVQRDVTVS
ncbi:MAG: sigma-54-dependent transcriptional regulator [Oligoflexales bacterium]